MSTTESELSQDVVFDILSSPRRRYVLYYLRSTGEPVQLTSLAEKVAAWENDVDPADITDQERKRVYVSLYQTHIPRLADAGFIEYDKESGQIAPADRTARIDRYLESPDTEWPWQTIYLLLAAASAFVLAMTALVDVIPELLAAAIVVTGVVVVVVAHFLRRQSKRNGIPEELFERE